MQLSSTDNSIGALKTALSNPRFDAYLANAKQDEALALELYLYNSRLAGAFIFPLGVMEITLRNSIDRFLVRKFGDQWYSNVDFTKYLHKQYMRPKVTGLVERLEGQQEDFTRNDIVSGLTFGFWTGLLNGLYHHIWKSELSNTFPGYNGESTILRKHQGDIRAKLTLVKTFRNRIAHHEPIYEFDARTYHSRVIDAIHLVCPVTSSWVKRNSKVIAVSESKPKGC